MTKVTQRVTRPQKSAVIPQRIRELAEAGAKGRSLSAVEVQELCEALRAQPVRAPTHFHSFAG